MRVPNGINRNRLWLILAVLSKHARLRLHTVDCHTNVVGGLTLTEPATDLAVALAVASSYFERPIAPDVAAIGEIGALLPPSLPRTPVSRCGVMRGACCVHAVMARPNSMG
jgi:DNA repair protein RadA/Sms